MRFFRASLYLALVILIGALVGCATSTKSPDVAKEIKTSLEQAGLKDVSVSQDRDKGIVTLGGKVAVESEKLRAESIAQPIAGAQVVANQIEIVPLEPAHDVSQVNKDLDDGIESNLNAALIEAKLHDQVKYSVSNHVVTLKGTVNSQETRERAERVAAAVLNVQQVVNELQVKEIKATTTKKS